MTSHTPNDKGQGKTPWRFQPRPPEPDDLDESLKGPPEPPVRDSDED